MNGESQCCGDDETGASPTKGLQCLSVSSQEAFPREQEEGDAAQGKEFAQHVCGPKVPIISTEKTYMYVSPRIVTFKMKHEQNTQGPRFNP